MTAFEIIRALAHDATVGGIITDMTILSPSPIILYANEAFGRLVGRDLTDIMGRNPRIMQGKETRRSTLDTFCRALMAGERFHGYLTNDREDGTKYRVEIDCRRLRAADGRVENFVAFERGVNRRIGRPGSAAGRYVPSNVSNDLLGKRLHGMSPFNHA